MSLIVVGDAFAGKNCLIRALGHDYLDEECRNRTSAINIYMLGATEVWVLGSNKFYLPLHKSLITQDTLTLLVMDGTYPYDHSDYWMNVCQRLGLTKIIRVFTKSDVSHSSNSDALRSKYPDAFFVSAKKDSPELESLRKTISLRANETVKIDRETELLIKAVKILTMPDICGTPQVYTVAETLSIKCEYPRYGVFTQDSFFQLLKHYSIFLLSDIKIFPQAIRNRLLPMLKDNFECNIDIDSNPDETPEFNETCERLLDELIKRRILYVIKLPDGREGYFLPQMYQVMNLPDSITNGIKVTCFDPAISYQLFSDILDLILSKYKLVWTKDTRFSSAKGLVKAQFWLDTHGLVKMFEYRSYVILELPPTLDVDFLENKFSYEMNVKPTFGKSSWVDKQWNEVVDSTW